MWGQYLAINFLISSALWAAVLICADSSRSNLDVVLRQLVSWPDGMITLVFEIADLSKNIERIVGKNKAKS